MTDKDFVASAPRVRTSYDFFKDEEEENKREESVFSRKLLRDPIEGDNVTEKEIQKAIEKRQKKEERKRKKLISALHELENEREMLKDSNSPKNSKRFDFHLKTVKGSKSSLGGPSEASLGSGLGLGLDASLEERRSSQLKASIAVEESSSNDSNSTPQSKAKISQQSITHRTESKNKMISPKTLSPMLISPKLSPMVSSSAMSSPKFSPISSFLKPSNYFGTEAKTKLNLLFKTAKNDLSLYSNIEDLPVER
jgi:hypothetical protein